MYGCIFSVCTCIWPLGNETKTLNYLHSFLLFVTKPYPKCSFTERLDIPIEIELKEVISGG